MLSATASASGKDGSALEKVGGAERVSVGMQSKSTDFNATMTETSMTIVVYDKLTGQTLMHVTVPR